MLPLTAFAAAWTVAPGKLEVYKNVFYYSTGEYFDANGDKQPQRRYTKYEINPYMEYGLLDGSTIGASWGVDTVRGSRLLVSNPDIYLTGNNYGISDPSLHFRQRLWQEGPYIVSAQPLIKFPTLFRHGFLPHSGSDSTDTELRLLGGYNFEMFGNSHFLNVETAYRKRFGGPGDQWNSGITLGIRPGGNWMLIPELSVIRNMGADNGVFTQSGEDNYDLLKPQFSAVYAFSDRLSLQAGAFTHLDGKNTGAGNGVMLSLWWRP